jgi:hypothetical protein
LQLTQISENDYVIWPKRKCGTFKNFGGNGPNSKWHRLNPKPDFAINSKAISKRELVPKHPK